MAAYALCGKFTTEARNRDALVSILADAADLMGQVDGCQMYIVYTDTADDTAVWVTELWDSQAAHDQSLTFPGVRELIAQARPLITGAPEQHILQPVSGKGL